MKEKIILAISIPISITGIITEGIGSFSTETVYAVGPLTFMGFGCILMGIGTLLLYVFMLRSAFQKDAKKEDKLKALLFGAAILLSPIMGHQYLNGFVIKSGTGEYSAYYEISTKADKRGGLQTAYYQKENSFVYRKISS